jgi:hypothetical protein
MSMIGRWLEEHGSELDALVAKIGKETGVGLRSKGSLAICWIRRLRFSSICTRSKSRSNLSRIGRPVLVVTVSTQK